MLFKIKKKKKYKYIEEGEGHPIVLLHGLMGGLSNFTEVLDYFSKRGFRVIIPELPLYTSTIITNKLDVFAKFINNFLTDLGIEKATLIGNSLGGHITLITALKYPEKVHSFVLTGSSGLYEKSFGESFPKISNYEYVKNGCESIFYNPKTATKEVIDDVYSTLNDRTKAIKIIYIARAAMRHNMADDLHKMNQPSLILWGKQDPVTPPDIAEEFHQKLPNSDLVWIDKCGHAPMMEHPKLFIQHLEEWLSKTIK